MASGLTIAVVGATGAAGQTTLRILEERKLPVRELRAFASERSVGKTVTFRGEPVTIQRIESAAFKGVDIAFCSAGTAQAKEFAPMIVKAGATVIDKSNAFRMDPNVPLIVPEINADAARHHQGILACPNCTTIVTVMPLKPLHDAGRLTRVIATSFQSVSGAGVNGIAELREQALAWAKGEAITPRQGEMVMFATRHRPIEGGRGWYRAALRHGVSTIERGTRYTLGVIFHDAR